MAFLLSGIRGAVQSERDLFFASLRNQADRTREVCAQAFYKARHQLRADVFANLNRQFLTAIEVECPTPRWQGLRLVAADASTVRLTLLDKNKVRTLVDAVTFGLFLPGIELCLACTLYPPRDGGMPQTTSASALSPRCASSESLPPTAVRSLS